MYSVYGIHQCYRVGKTDILKKLLYLYRIWTMADIGVGLFIIIVCYSGIKRINHNLLNKVTSFLRIVHNFTYIVDSSSRGFNASYHVNRCPYHCHSNRTCVGNRCVCQEGYGGVTCETLLCPNNCSADQNQGICNQVRLLLYLLGVIPLMKCSVFGNSHILEKCSFYFYLI